MITDHSSVGFEYTLLDRPIVVIDCPELIARARIAPSKVAALRSAADVVSSAEEVPAAIKRQLADPGSRRAQRHLLARTFFYKPGTATERAVGVFYQLLGLDAPDARVSPSRPASQFASIAGG